MPSEARRSFKTRPMGSARRPRGGRGGVGGGGGGVGGGDEGVALWGGGGGASEGCEAARRVGARAKKVAKRSRALLLGGCAEGRGWGESQGGCQGGRG